MSALVKCINMFGILDHRTAKCRSCSSSVAVWSTAECPKCGFDHSESEIKIMKQEASLAFNKSGMVGLVFFPLFIISVYHLNEQYQFINKCACYVLRYGCSP